MGTYLVLDGHSLAFRAWFALSESGLATASGQETAAVHGFVSMVARVLTDLRPAGMAVAFDRPEPTFRDEIAPEYKAGRAPTPDSLRSQIELIRRFVELLGIPLVEAAGYEADDVIATLAGQLAGAGEDVVIVTGDRDAFQLVEDPRVRVLYNRRGVSDTVMYDEAAIEERTGVAPASYPLLAALRGDPSDNLPGVPGVGEKTAAKLVRDWGDADGIFSHLAELTPKLRASLAEHEPRVRRNLELIPLVRDVPLPEVTTEQLSFSAVDRGALIDLFDLLEMRAARDRLFAILDSLGGGGSAPRRPGEARREAAAFAGGPVVPAEAGEPAPFDLLPLETAGDAVAALRELAGGGRRFVVEPAWLGSPGRSQVEGLGLLVPGDVPPDTAYWLEGDLVEGSQDVREALGRALAVEDGARKVIGHRVKELMRFLGESAGIDVTGLDLDLAVAAYLVDPSEGQASLDELAERHGLGAPEAEPASPRGRQLTLTDSLEAEKDGRTATAARAATIAALAPAISSELASAGATLLYEDVERPLVRVLARMEIAGIGVDVERLRAISSELTDEALSLEAEVQTLAGESFNVNSTPQLRSVLYDKLKLSPHRKTKTGYSTDAATLERLRGEHPIVDALLRYREVEKLRSTYGEGLLSEVAADGRIHASFNQTVARTGRLSSDQPNLHNIPVRTDEGRRFRDAFVPAPGMTFLVADYNQIELRVIAHLAADPGLTEAFTSGTDIHNATASRVFSVAPHEVTTAMRSKAKMISYGLAYGMEAYGLSQRLGVPVEEARAILGQYFIAFPAVKSYMDRTVAEARLKGYTETAFGRRRFLPELASSNYGTRQAAERQAMNAGIQGLAADVFKVALVRIDEALETGRLVSRIVLQVHDEVILEVARDERETVAELVVDTMRGACELSVPLEVNYAWGDSWAAAKEA